MRALGALLVIAACYGPTFPSNVRCGIGDVCPSGQMCIAGYCTSQDGGVDAAPSDMTRADVPPSCSDWQAKHFDACALPAPMGDLHLTMTLSPYNWDTSTNVLKGKQNTVIPVATTVISQLGGPDVVLASVASFTVDMDVNLSINGTRPLLVAAWGDATINGDIDASASYGTAGAGGAAAPAPACGSARTGNNGSNGMPATGGGGGGYQGNGGRGGNAGGGGGSATASSLIIHGGCAGGAGGVGTGTGGARGAGGGALQITSRTSITIASTAEINAGGGGGGGGPGAYDGGGGGGTGGYVGLDAPHVTIGGVVAANGGGGGGGASDAASGSIGSNARIGTTVANGGAGAATSTIGTCASGANGAAGGMLNGQNAGNSPCGGGGGGGAAGFILVWSPSLNVTGTISPPAAGGPN